MLSFVIKLQLTKTNLNSPQNAAVPIQFVSLAASANIHTCLLMIWDISSVIKWMPSVDFEPFFHFSSSQYQEHPVQLVIWGWLVEQHQWKVELNCAPMECGALYVITSGVLEMQRLSVDNWVYQLQVGRYTVVEVVHWLFMHTILNCEDSIAMTHQL